VLTFTGEEALAVDRCSLASSFLSWLPIRVADVWLWAGRGSLALSHTQPNPSGLSLWAPALLELREEPTWSQNTQQHSWL